MVTRADVAKKAKVSTMTVTRVVTQSGYVSEETRKRVEEAIIELEYIPNRIASSLKQKNSKSIAVLLQELSNPYYTQLAEAMIERARKHGYSVFLFEVRNGDPDAAVKEAISNRVGGVLNMLFDRFSDSLCKQLETYEIRGIYTGQRNDFSFSIDYSKAIEKAVARLYESGCRRPIFVAGVRFKDDMRMTKFASEAKKYGMEVTDKSILLGEYPLVESFVVGYESMKKFFADGNCCDSVFCLNDMMALGAMKAARESGKKIPDDLSVIGFDNIAIDKYFSPSLTSIGVDYIEQAKYYTDFLTGKIDSAAITLEAEYFPRESTQNVAD